MRTKHIMYKPTGVCSQAIDVTADENDVIQQVFFLGGCNGNLQGISKLVTGQRIDDVISRLQGIRCGHKSTSCPDQLTEALKELKNASLEE
ncbi:MAG: TIGR03905 family TSCPD domain-containing protein [Prevotella sp.]|nr:TIGR03905 family TSCPD domain-containing protein [Prevotella sp.]